MGRYDWWENKMFCNKMLYVAGLPLLCWGRLKTGKLGVENGTPFSFKDWLEGGNKWRVEEVLIAKESFRNCMASKPEIQTNVPPGG